MNLSVLLEVATGLVLMYLLLSLLVTAVNELLAQFSSIRARHLASALRHMLKLKPGPDDPANLALFDALVNSPTLQIAGAVAKTSMSGGMARPSYLSRDTFLAALREAIPKVPNVTLPADTTRSDLAALVQALPADSQIKISLTAAIASATAKAQSVEQAVGDWFDSMMERATGGYKRWMSAISLLVGLILAVALNCDTIHVVTELAKSPELRAQISKVSEQVAARCTSQDGRVLTTTECNQVKDNLAALQALPVGGPIDFGRNPWAALGWLITGIAVSFGAPFWFDLLSKVANVRSSLKPSERHDNQGGQAR
jgi:hypothetical protein